MVVNTFKISRQQVFALYGLNKESPLHLVRFDLPP